MGSAFSWPVSGSSPAGDDVGSTRYGYRGDTPARSRSRSASSRSRRGWCSVALGREPARVYTLDSLDMVSGFGSILKDVARKLGIPTRRVNSFTRRQRIGRETLRRYTAEFEARARSGEQNIDPELRRLRTLLDQDVTWDEILEIREVAASPGSVYDFSVPGVETFTTAEGVVTHNTMRTFHYAGVAGMNLTLVPR